MRVVFLSEFFPATEQGELRGGVEARAFYVAKYLAARHDVTVLASYESGMEREARLFGSTLRVVRCGPQRAFTQDGDLLGRARFMRAARRTLRGLDGDILDAQSLIAYAPAWEGGKRFRRRVMTVHDVWQGRWVRLFGIAGLIGEAYERYANSRPWDAVVANSAATQRRLLSIGLPADCVSVIYNGIEFERLQSFRRSEPAKPVVTYVGRLVSYKCVDDLIAAAGRLQARFPAILLQIIGVGPEEKKLKAQAIALNLQKNVRFLGHIPSHEEVMRLMAASTVFSLPSTIEGFGMATMEAMALGIPFVNADLDVTREITAGAGGTFFPARDVGALTASLERILADSELAERLGGQGKERAKNFDWQRIATQTEELYGRLLSREPVGEATP